MGKKSKAPKAEKKTPIAGGGGTGPTAGKKKSGANPFGDETGGKSSNSPIQSIYQIYKAATLRFKEGLSRLVPRSIFNDDHVRCFLDAADYVEEQGIAVDASLLRDLRLAINVRKKYSQRLDDGGDEGHAYFMLVLNYCLQVLGRRRTGDEDASRADTVSTGEAADGERGDGRAFFNRYGALSLEDPIDLEDGGANEAGEDSAPLERPEPPAGGKAYSSADLMWFPDRAQCMFLFDTMAYHVAKLSVGMKNLKETMRMEAEGDYPMKLVPRELVSMGMLARQMILDVERLESELYVECPDLGESPYRVMAVCFFTPFINLIAQNVRTYSPLSSKFKDVHSIAFFGDIIESVFRCNMDEIERISTRFGKRWKLPQHWKMKNQWIASQAARIALINLRTDWENKLFEEVQFTEDEEYLKGNIPDWLGDEKSWIAISGDRSILNTMRMLDIFGSGTSENENSMKTHLFVKLMPYIFSCKWDDQSNTASSIRGDMDSALLEIFFSILNSKWRFDGLAVPMEKRMLPVVDQVRNWSFSHLKAGQPMAFVFSLHCMLVSIFELQGDDDVARVASISKAAFNNFMLQTEEHLQLDIPCSRDREHCLKFVIGMKRIAERSNDWEEKEPSLENFDLLFWNPLCSGLILSYTNTYLSLQAGVCSMNTCHETHAILHIYNALKDRGLVDEDLPVLSTVDDCFGKVVSIWNGWAKPKQGKFTYRHLLSIGLPHECALWEQDVRRHQFKGGQESRPKPQLSLAQLRRNSDTSKRVSDSIHAEDLSKTYRRNCIADFEDLDETFNTDPTAPRHLRIDPSSSFPMPFQMFDVRSYLLFSSFSSECDSLLKYNLVAVGTVFSEFLYKTFNENNNEGIAKLLARKDVPFRHKGDIRSLVHIQSTSEVLAALDFIEDDDTFAFLGEAFEDFFNNLDLSRVLLYGTNG